MSGMWLALAQFALEFTSHIHAPVNTKLIRVLAAALAAWAMFFDKQFNAPIWFFANAD